MTKPLRIAFMGSPDFAVPVAAALQQAGHEIACVYSQPPRRAGRGKTLRQTPVYDWAEAAGIEVRTPRSLKNTEEKQAFMALNLDAAVVVAYGLILPQAVLDAPRLGCMNMHASLLPRWRGAAPIQRAIMAGDTVTGVQAMMMEAGLDTGPILATAQTPISLQDTAGSVHDRLSALAGQLAPQALAGLADGSLLAQEQPCDGAIYAHKISAEDQKIDWSKSAAEVDWQIRGLSPAPGAWFYFQPPGEEKIRIKVRMSALQEGYRADNQALPDGDERVMKGVLLDDRLLVACGDGKAVRLLSVQKPGSKALDAQTFLRGLAIPAGSRLT